MKEVKEVENIHLLVLSAFPCLFFWVITVTSKRSASKANWSDGKGKLRAPAGVCSSGVCSFFSYLNTINILLTTYLYSTYKGAPPGIKAQFYIIEYLRDLPVHDDVKFAILRSTFSQEDRAIVHSLPSNFPWSSLDHLQVLTQHFSHCLLSSPT